jgi:sigma-E factor negative regulatory protein RseC
MQEKQSVEHEGIISEIHSDYTIASIVSSSACGSCHAKGACGLSETTEKLVKVPAVYPGLKAGDRVRVVLQRAQGLRAVFYAYVMPLIVFILTVSILLTITSNEIISALFAFFVTALYYLVLFTFRNRIEKTFVFTIKSN